MLYVTLQFLLLIVIVWPLATAKFSIVASVFILFSACIALSALVANRPGNFNVRPHPKQSGILITHGPYKFIRHPMYSSLFFGTLGVLLCQFSIIKVIAWVLLLVVLAIKARIEEKALCEHHPEYCEYQKSTKSFIPWIW